MGVLGFGLLLMGAAAPTPGVPLQEGTVARLAPAKEAAALLSARDDFVKAMSPFDRAARLHSAGPVSEEAYLAHVGRQAREWTPAESAKAEAAVRKVAGRIAPFKLGLPKEVLLLKTTGDEEGHAAYCRGNAVVLPQNMVDGPPAELERILIHELFHILSRQDPKLREALYGILGFRACPEAPLPADLRDRKITNPDAPRNDHAVDIEDGGGTVTVVPVLFSETDYSPERGGEFFDYLQFKLLVVKQEGDEPVLLDPVRTPGFLDKVGRNTDYLFHPEEVLADNFVLLVDGARGVPTPRILDEMRKALSPGK